MRLKNWMKRAYREGHKKDVPEKYQKQLEAWAEALEGKKKPVKKKEGDE